LFKSGGTMTINENPQQKTAYGIRNRKLEWRSRWFLGLRPENDDALMAIRDRALAFKRRKIADQIERFKDLPMAAYGAPGVGTPWFNIGPRNINGRVKALAVHPTNPDIVYAASASGGVWKTEDGGQSWYSLWNDQLSLTLGGIAIAPSNPNRIYAGTGEGVIPNTYGAAHNYPGAGLYVSTDSGASWGLQTALNNRRTTRVMVDPSDELRVYVSGWSGLERSTDGGITWTTLRTGVVSDFVLDSNNSNTIYCCVHTDGVYKSTDGGANWTLLNNAPTSTGLRWPRIDICQGGTYGSNFLVLKNSAANAVAYTTTDGGSTWSLIPGWSWSHFSGWCDLIAVAPDNENYMLAGGVSLHVTTNGDTSWSVVAGMHADEHRAIYAPSNPDIVYVCDDGGVYRSTNKGVTFSKVSHGLVITQFYDVGSWDPISNVVGGGAQDQGTNVTTGGLTWKKIYEADGGYLVIDPTDPRTMYSESQSTNIRKTTDGGQTWISKTGGLTSTSQWVGVIVMDPNNNQVLYTGGRRIFKNTDSLTTNWVAVSQDFGFDVNSIAVAPSDSNRVYAGTGNFYNRTGQGRVFRTDDGGATTTWTEITSTLPSSRPVMDIIVDPTNRDRVVVAYGGNTGGAASCVFISTNAGVSWTDISSDLPDVPVSAIAFDPNDLNTIYAGTDVGVYATNNLGANWLAYDNGIPNCPIHDLHADASERVLYAATFGRGMYKLNIAPVVSTPAVDLYLRDSVMDVGQIIPSPSSQPNPLDISDTVHWWESPDIKVDVAPYFAPNGLFDGVEFDNDLVHENPQRGVTNRFYLQVHNRGYNNATNVSVRAFLADASAGLPSLPNALTPPNFNLSPGDWTPIGAAQTILVLEPNRPAIVSWDFNVPLTAATHSCLLAVVSSAEDPITTTETNVGVLIPNEKRVCLKNLHVIDASPSPFHQIVTINFRNVFDEEDLIDIIIRPELMDEGNIGLVLEPHEIANTERALENVEIYSLSKGEYIGEWYENFSRIRVSDLTHFPKGQEQISELEGIHANNLIHLTAEREQILKLRNQLIEQLDYTRLYDFDTSKIGMIRGIKLQPNQVLRAVITARANKKVPYDAVQRFTVYQQQRGQIMGGNTYEIRLKRAKGLHPVSKIRVVLERVQILNDHDPCLKGKGEFVFNAYITFNKNPNRRHRIRVPEYGFISIGDKGAKSVRELNVVLYEGFVGVEDNMEVTILPIELDYFDPDDQLVRYSRIFMAPPETWLGEYVPGDEEQSADLESLADWRVWYRVESLPL
jgi:photosystem II stability/assembly factor-like uncharacterized protein